MAYDDDDEEEDYSREMGGGDVLQFTEAGLHTASGFKLTKSDVLHLPDDFRLDSIADRGTSIVMSGAASS